MSGEDLELSTINMLTPSKYFFVTPSGNNLVSFNLKSKSQNINSTSSLPEFVTISELFVTISEAIEN